MAIKKPLLVLPIILSIALSSVSVMAMVGEVAGVQLHIGAVRHIRVVGDSITYRLILFIAAALEVGERGRGRNDLRA